MKKTVDANASGHAEATVDAKVTRGQESWAYIYTVLGFVVTIEATVIGMMTPLVWWQKIIFFAVLAGVTIWEFIENGWLHNKLIGLKVHYEGKAR